MASLLHSPALKRTLAAGGAALLLGGAAIGVVGAQQPTPTPVPGRTPTPATAAQATPGATAQRPGFPGGQAFWDAVSRRLGITAERLQQAITEARTEAGIPDRNGRGGRGPGGLGIGGPRVRIALDVAAQTLGLTPAQLRTELSGKSLADVARARNIDPARVADALKADANTRIDRAATDGRIAADQVAALKQRTATEIDASITRQVPARPARAAGTPGPSTTPGPRA